MPQYAPMPATHHPQQPKQPAAQFPPTVPVFSGPPSTQTPPIPAALFTTAVPPARAQPQQPWQSPSPAPQAPQVSPPRHGLPSAPAPLVPQLMQGNQLPSGLVLPKGFGAPVTKKSHVPGISVYQCLFGSTLGSDVHVVISVPLGKQVSWGNTPVVVWLTPAGGGDVVSDERGKHKSRWIGEEAIKTLTTVIWISPQQTIAPGKKAWRSHPSKVMNVANVIDSVEATMLQANRAPHSLHLAGFSRGGWWASYFAAHVCDTVFKSITVIGGYPSEAPKDADMEESAKHLATAALATTVIGSTSDVLSPPSAYLKWYETLEAEGAHVRILHGLTHEDLYSELVYGRDSKEPEITAWLHGVWRSV